MSTENEQLKDPEFQLLIQKYLKYVTHMITEANVFVDEGNFEKLAKIGHNLKGTGSSYGFEDITTLGNNLYNSAQAKDIDKIKDNILKLAKILDTASK